jgi:hypothetical protein
MWIDPFLFRTNLLTQQAVENQPTKKPIWLRTIAVHFHGPSIQRACKCSVY